MKPAARIVFWRRVGRALVGAVWSLPLRYITLPLVFWASLTAAGGVITADDLRPGLVITAGVLMAVALRAVENLLLEFALFPALMRVLRGRK